MEHLELAPIGESTPSLSSSSNEDTV